MAIVDKVKWTPSDGIILEDNASEAIKATENALVVAGPGAGKTELLAQKANYLFETNMCKSPNKILAISFKKDAAKNLKDRIIKRCGKEIASRFDSMTYDAFAKSLLDHFRLALPNELRPNPGYIVEDRSILKEAFGKHNYYEYKMFDEVLTSVSLPFTHDNIGARVWKLLLKGFDGNESMLTFKMISMLVEYIVRTNGMIKLSLQSTYKYVFLDEFQDTTDLQYTLVKQCFLGSNTVITAVGDNKQRIMVWAGARKTIFDDYKKEFNSSIYKLVMNHRSSPRLVDLQRKMYASLNESDIKVLHSNKWDISDGSINLIIAENVESETTTIVNSILQKITSGTQLRDICIICKQTPIAYTKTIIDTLEQHNICARIENDYQDLIKEPIVDILLAILNLAYDRQRPDDWELVVSSIIELWSITYSQSNEDYYNTLNKIERELSWVKQKLINMTSKKEFDDVLKDIVSFLGLDQIKAMFAEYNQGKYLDEIINKFEEYLWIELEKTNINLKNAIKRFKGVCSIPIMTIHKSKGLEYEVVYFVGLEDSAFWNFKNQPEEDRCAFFVALSRAKTDIYFSFCKNRNQQLQHHNTINEFFELLQEPGVANIIKC